MRHCMQVRDSLPADRFFDVDYRDVARDPIGEVRRIYDFLGMRLSPETVKQMEWWVAENRRDKRAPHEYTLDKFGLTEEEIERDFAEYRRRHIRS